MAAVSPTPQLYCCQSSRAEVYKLLGLLVEAPAESLDKTQLFLADPGSYLPLVETILTTAKIPFKLQQSAPLSRHQLWHAWVSWQRFMTAVVEGAPLVNKLLECLASGELALTPTEQRQLGEPISQLPWHSPIDKLLETIATVNAECPLLNIPHMDDWSFDSSQHRLALFDWLLRLPGIKRLIPLGSDESLSNEFRQLLAGDYQEWQQLLAAAQSLSVDITYGDKGVAIAPLDRLVDGASDGMERTLVVGWLRRHLGGSSQRLLPTLNSLCRAGHQVVLYATHKGEMRDSATLAPLPPETTVDLVEASNSSILASPIEEALLAVETPQLPGLERLSASAVGEYATCAYRYFAAYHLQLAPAELSSPWQLPRRRIGELVHQVLEEQFGSEPPLLSEEKLEAYGKKFFADEISGVLHLVAWQEVKRLLQRAVKGEQLWLEECGAEVVALEQSFELPVEVPLGTSTVEVTVRGRIDRVDRLNGGGMVVIDYKSGGGKFGPAERQAMYDLIRPQLPIYLLAVAKLYDDEPLAAIEVRLRSDERGGLVHEKEKKRFKAARFMKLKAAEFLPHFEENLKTLLSSMLAGDVAPAPHQPQRCGLRGCAYYGVCRFDIDVGELR